MSLRSRNDCNVARISSSVPPIAAACCANGRSVTGRSSCAMRMTCTSQSERSGAGISALRSGFSWASTSAFASAAVSPVMSSFTPIL